MKKAIFFAALAMAAGAQAQTADSLAKLSETTFADGQEVSRVYVTSPFIPDAWGDTWSRDSKYVGVHLPSLYFQGIDGFDGLWQLWAHDAFQERLGA